MKKKILMPIFLFSLAGTALAYNLLQPLPGVGQTVNTFPDYITKIIPFILGLAAVLAVVEIVIGGIEYAVTEAIDSKADAIDRIRQAIFGLLLALASWLILSTINPALVNLQLNIPGLPSAPQNTTQPPQPPIPGGGGDTIKPPAVNIDENTKKNTTVLLNNLQSNGLMADMETDKPATFQELADTLKKYKLIGEEDSIGNLDEYIAVLNKWGLDSATRQDTIDFRSGDTDVVPDAVGFSQGITAGLEEISKTNLVIANVPAGIKIEQGFPKAQQDAIKNTVASVFADLPDSYKNLAQKYDINVLGETSYNNLGSARMGIKELSEDSKGITDVGFAKLILIDAEPNSALKPTQINPDKNQLYGIITHELAHAWVKENLGARDGDTEWRSLAQESLNIFKQERTKGTNEAGAADKAGCPTVYACERASDMLTESVAMWNLSNGDFRIADSKGNELLQKKFEYLKRKGAIKQSL